MNRARRGVTAQNVGKTSSLRNREWAVNEENHPKMLFRHYRQAINDQRTGFEHGHVQKQSAGKRIQVEKPEKAVTPGLGIRLVLAVFPIEMKIAGSVEGNISVKPGFFGRVPAYATTKLLGRTLSSDYP